MTCCVYSLAAATQTLQQHKSRAARGWSCTATVTGLVSLFGGTKSGASSRRLKSCGGQKLTRVKGEDAGRKAPSLSSTPDKSRHSNFPFTGQREVEELRHFSPDIRLRSSEKQKKTTQLQFGRAKIQLLLLLLLLLVTCVFHPNVRDTAAPHPDIIRDTPQTHPPNDVLNFPTARNNRLTATKTVP